MTDIQDMLLAMGSIADPWGLFEPYVWKDKIGDSLWHCELRSVDTILFAHESKSLEAAVSIVYNAAMATGGRSETD